MAAGTPAGDDGVPVLPGPKREPGAPVGPEEVRAAVIDAAADLFARRGVHAVTLRDVAAAADVQLTLIGRYVGKRDDLIRAVYDDVAAELAEEIIAHPLQRLRWGVESPAGRWAALLVHHSLEGSGPPLGAPNPVLALATTFEEAFGQDPRSAQMRAAQVTAIALGWRLLEDFLLEAAELPEVDRERARDELTAMQITMAQIPWTDDGESAAEPVADRSARR